jgi:hypothetical protein
MKISGRTIAYLIILLAAFLVGGITFAGAQGFPQVNSLPVPVEENGIVEVVRHGGNISFGFFASQCSFETKDRDWEYVVPAGKRLIVEHATANAINSQVRRYRSPAWIEIKSEVGFEETTTMKHIVAFSENGFPVGGGGPMTFYAEQGESVFFHVRCPIGIQSGDHFSFDGSFTGRLVPHPHPSMIPTATPPP